jgi:hypothetical protein
MVAALYAHTCLSEISNTDYEGEIKEKGDTVKIRVTPHITIRDYDASIDLESDEPARNMVELLINKGKYFNFPANYVDVKQSDIDYVDRFAESGGKDMKVAIEKDVFAAIYADAASANAGATAGAVSGDINLGITDTPVTVSKDNIIDEILKMELVLDEQNVPQEGRWLILPSWAHTAAMASDLKNASITGDEKSALRVGKIGNFANFDIYKTNNLYVETNTSTDKVTNIVAGHRDALTFATQLVVDGEKIKAEKRFLDYYRSLNVFGFKVVKGESLVHAVWKKG